jgi:excinuclease ABC subunit C
MLEFDCGQEFDPGRAEEFFATIPARPAVYLLEPRQPDAQPYLRRTADLRRSCERVLGPNPSASLGISSPGSDARLPPQAPGKRLNLREVTARIRYRLTGSTFEQLWVLYGQARKLFPERYRDFIRLRRPPLVKINLANEYPRCYVTQRINSDGGFYFGPFPTRKTAEGFAREFLNLFKIRRCQIKIRRDPAFPGCIYSEMKMCLAPCFAGCSKQEYDAEVARVTRFLGSAGRSLAAEFEREREAASEALDFERAAAAHKKHEKVADVLRGLPELPRRLDELDAVVLQLAAEPGAVAVFHVVGGLIADPFLLRFAELASQPRSAEEILRDALGAERESAETPARLDRVAERAEQLALLARWFYSRPRQGEIFFSESAQAGWPYRRIVRGCSRVLAGKSSLPAPT